MTAKTAAYVVLNKGSMQYQLLYTSRLSDGNAYMLGRSVTSVSAHPKWRVRYIDANTTIADTAKLYIDKAADVEFVSLHRPEFAALTDADESDITRLAVPRGLLRRITSGTSSVKPSLAPEDKLSDRRFETIIDLIPEGSTFVSWLLEQDAE